MKLWQWIEDNNLSVAQFAGLIMTCRATVYHWKNGTYKPSKHFIKLIQQKTKGQVKEEDWK